MGTAVEALLGGTGGGAAGFFAGAGVGAIPGATLGGLKGAAWGAAAGAFVNGLVFASKDGRPARPRWPCPSAPPGAPSSTGTQ